MHEECNHLNELLAAEREIILRHLQNHKWFLQIVDEQEAKVDFVKKFGWLMRELYCGYACPDRQNCKIAQEFISQNADPK
ncbi:MAG: hypothetical protein NTX00_04765 [Candidatus Parcubacteria bacterium]|nr:hypothetical protein [Candidatus Parcubacteria bacterium]